MALDTEDFFSKQYNFKNQNQTWVNWVMSELYDLYTTRKLDARKWSFQEYIVIVHWPEHSVGWPEWTVSEPDFKVG